MNRVYLDTEYCYPGMKKGTPRPTSADKRQIVQISAIIFNTDNGEEVAHFDQLVRPAYENKLPDFFIELTGITQQQVDTTAISFNEALRKFVAFCDSTPIWTFDKDEEVLLQNCRYISAQWPFAAPFTRVKPLLANWGIDSSSYSSGTLYKAAGIQLSGHVHNALHDVRSMAQAIHAFEKRVESLSNDT